jgi:LacI family transcriptional regulator
LWKTFFIFFVVFYFQGMSRITIKDIARLLGINVSTVSRALTNHPNVNADTRQRVIELANEMGYMPNTLAVNLRRRHSGLVALLISEINMFFVPSVIRAIEEQMRLNGYRLLILQSKDSYEAEAENLKICRQLAVEGILVSLSAETQELKHFDAIFEEGIPVVFFDKVPAGDYNSVRIDDAKTACNATDYLVQQGHKHICGLFGLPSLRITGERLKGFRKRLATSGLIADPNLELFAANSQLASTMLLQLLQQNKHATALFAMSDELLVGAVQAAEEAGLKVPYDFSIICISDGSAPNFYSPRISHLHHSGYEIGLAASKRLLDLITEGINQPPQQIELECHLVTLHSVGAPLCFS